MTPRGPQRAGLPPQRRRPVVGGPGGVPHYSRSGDRHYTMATAKVSSKGTNASKVMVRWLTRCATGATLAIPDLVRDSNPRMRMAARKLDLRLPRVVWLPTKFAVYSEAWIAAPCRDACLRIWPPKRPMLVHAAPTSNNLSANTPAATPKGRCRKNLTHRPGGHRRP